MTILTEKGKKSNPFLTPTTLIYTYSVLTLLNDT